MNYADPKGSVFCTLSKLKVNEGAGAIYDVDTLE